MIIVEMSTAHVVVATDTASGNRILILKDEQTAIEVHATLTPEGARQIGGALSTSLHIAGSPLPPKVH